MPENPYTKTLSDYEYSISNPLVSLNTKHFIFYILVHIVTEMSHSIMGRFDGVWMSELRMGFFSDATLIECIFSLPWPITAVPGILQAS
jgi:hypothetical protein